MIDLAEQAKTLFDLELGPQTVAQMEFYLAELLEWNAKFNLTAITKPDDVRIKHILDSLSVLSLPHLPNQAKVIDLGTGAGLPALILGMVKPDWQILAVDATAKKITFLEHIIRELGLKNCTALQARAEDLGQNPQHREKYDIALARALAYMPVLAEYLLPLSKDWVIAMKGLSAPEETRIAEKALEILGGKLEQIYPIQLPDMEKSHHLVCIRKVAPTPAQYPRRAGLPIKKPLL